MSKRTEIDTIKDFFNRVEALGDLIPSWDRVEVVGFDGDYVTVKWDRGRCGEVDIEYDDIPFEWIYLSPEEGAARHAARRHEAETKQKEWMDRQRVESAKRSAEAIEKAERSNYERLKAKYENHP